MAKIPLKPVLLTALGLIASSCALTAFAQPDSVAIFAQNTESIFLAEERLGKLATENGTSQAVRNYGSMIAKQDATMEISLKRAAQTVQVVLPATADAEEQKFYDRLSKLSGAAFDRAYAANMVQVQQAQDDAFRGVAELGPFAAIDMAPIKTFAEDNLRIIEAQLQQAQQMAETVGANSPKPGPTAPAN